MSDVSHVGLWAGSVRSSAFALSFPSYYRANEVQQFRYSRPFRKGEKDPENEFAVSQLGLFSRCMCACPGQATHVRLEARSRPWMSFLRSFPSCYFDSVSFLGTAA